MKFYQKKMQDTGSKAMGKIKKNKLIKVQTATAVKCGNDV
jgi:hypothetical protein